MVNPQCQKLGALLKGVAVLPASLENCEVSGLAVDSQKVNPGDLFFALKGHSVDGVDYLQDALDRGAAALLWDSDRDVLLGQGVPVDQLAEQVGVIASRFYGAPSEVLRIAAVTGTDGKSSVTHFIASAMEQIEPGSAAIVGTLGAHLVREEVIGAEGGHTTPPPVDLQRILSQLREEGAETVALEASSHGIDQHRLAGCAIDTAVLTQAGRDHLDYHGTVDAYHEAKRTLFHHPGLKAAVVNLDDTLGQQIAAHSPEEVRMIRYSTVAGCGADLLGEVLVQDREGMEIQLCYQQEFRQIRTPLYGRFNLSNLLAALGTLISWQVPFAEAVDALRAVEAIPGRMERFSGDQGATLLVDYAHTPGALEAALQAVRQHLQGGGGGALWVVFGCGGDRDQGKRSEMGRIAERDSDHVILTNDNPRNEAPSDILSQILQGMNDPDAVTVIEDRERAIHYAWQQAAVGDVVLIAGKGHEQSQWIGAECLPLSDREIAAALVQGRVSND